MSRQVVVMRRLKIKKVGKTKSMQITQTKNNHLKVFISIL